MICDSHCAGSSDGEISNANFKSEQRTRRKWKRRSSTKQSEGMYHAVSNRKENAKTENPSSDLMPKGQVWSQGDGIHHSGKIL